MTTYYINANDSQPIISPMLPIKIVTLDDDKLVTRAIWRTIHTLNRDKREIHYEVIQYQDGEKVLEDLSSHTINPSLFITDLDMPPFIDGYQFINGLHQQRRTEPIIIYSTFKFIESKVTYDGKMTYLIKGNKNPSLIDIVQSFC